MSNELVVGKASFAPYTGVAITNQAPTFDATVYESSNFPKERTVLVEILKSIFPEDKLQDLGSIKTEELLQIIIAWVKAVKANMHRHNNASDCVDSMDFCSDDTVDGDELNREEFFASYASLKSVIEGQTVI